MIDVAKFGVDVAKTPSFSVLGTVLSTVLEPPLVFWSEFVFKIGPLSRGI
jgi:hypothetical protein